MKKIMILMMLFFMLPLILQLLFSLHYTIQLSANWIPMEMEYPMFRMTIQLIQHVLIIIIILQKDKTAHSLLKMNGHQKETLILTTWLLIIILIK